MRVKRRISRHKRFYRNIILVTCLLVVFMTIGYAAFQTNISFKAKGNIKEKTITVTDLINNVVTSGDGLYEDFTETGRYVYKGANPNNYIKLGDDIYRIIAIESDGTLKVIKNESIDDNLFDDARSCSEVAYVDPKRKTKTITNGSKTIYEIDIIG